MNCDILKIVRGNDFATQMTITALDAGGNVIEDFSLEDSTEVVVKYTLAGNLHEIEAYDYEIEGNDITIQWSDLALGKYGFEIEGKFNGYSWRSAARFIFQIVADNASANIPDGVLVDGVYKLSDWLRLLSGTGGGGKQVQANWTETDTNSPAYIQNKPNLAPVATSGSYNDLTDKPSIPDVSGKADKVSGAVAGDFAALDENGNLTDSGKKASDFATAAQGAKADTAIQDISGKQDVLVSGTNIKTINNESILGSGNITIEGGGDVESVNGQTGVVVLDAEDVGAAPQTTTYTKAEVDAALAAKQNTLVSGTNIATINGADITQGGNVSIVAVEGQTITIDAAPTSGSTNPVSSGGVAHADSVIMYGDRTGGIEYTFANVGKWMNVSTVGSTATEESKSNFGYIQIPCVAGDYFRIYATGSTNTPTSIAFTDSQLNVLSNSNAQYTNYRLQGFLKAEYDGFLIVNNYFSSIPSPKITKITTGVTGTFNLANNTGYINTKTIGNAASFSNTSNWGCVAIPLVAGQTAKVYTLGGGNARAWALLKEGNIILSNAAANLNCTTTPAVVTALQSCILVVNNNYSSNSSAKVIVEGNPYLVDLDNRLKELEANNSPKQLKILAIGNSFTDGPLDYMYDFLANLQVANVTVYKVTIGSSSIAQWWERYQNGNTYTPSLVSGSSISNIGSTLKQIFAHDWDYVVFQQLSSLSATYSTIEPNLYSLIAHVKADCTNPSCKIAWQMTWSWSPLYSETGPKGLDGYNSIVSCVESIIDYYKGSGVDVIIPSGTAMQNARGTSLNNEADLTYDYKHAAAGVGKYVLCATWYKALAEKFTGKSVMESTMTISATPSSSDLGAESVTAENRNLCLMCVEYAVANPYHVSTIVE